MKTVYLPWQELSSFSVEIDADGVNDPRPRYFPPLETRGSHMSFSKRRGVKSSYLRLGDEQGRGGIVATGGDGSWQKRERKRQREAFIVSAPVFCFLYL